MTALNLLPQNEQMNIDKRLTLGTEHQNWQNKDLGKQRRVLNTTKPGNGKLSECPHMSCGAYAFLGFDTRETFARPSKSTDKV
jgi:hypothetical protein